ncbi:hypothetical protein NYE48_27155 [Paenibacillus sp. FSL M7-1455]|uniref:hypothetical protein n=1 Tax=Paenibacillus sp. FSL M7-1455 TaxID=2975316 RepID=UPI0030FC7673
MFLNLRKVLSSIVVLSMLLLSSLSVYAEGTQLDYSEYVKELIKNYQSPINSAPVDSRFVNEMVLMQEEKNGVIKSKVNLAQSHGEDMYSLDQILNADAVEFGISQEDMDRIKESIRMEKSLFENVYAAFEDLSQENHPLAKNIKEELEKKYPASMIYVDHTLDTPKDGQISGGGWPNCLDDNGWGYQNFIGSDCSLALALAKLCAMDSTIGGDLRYCKPNVRNCSPLIFHDKYWHTH